MLGCPGGHKRGLPRVVRRQGPVPAASRTIRRVITKGVCWVVAACPLAARLFVHNKSLRLSWCSTAKRGNKYSLCHRDNGPPIKGLARLTPTGVQLSMATRQKTNDSCAKESTNARMTFSDRWTYHSPMPCTSRKGVRSPVSGDLQKQASKPVSPVSSRVGDHNSNRPSTTFRTQMRRNT